jgi:hypothetical protein
VNHVDPSKWSGVLRNIICGGTAQSVSAMETEVTLNQDKAISGGITPGDAPGFPTTTVIQSTQ